MFCRLARHVRMQGASNREEQGTPRSALQRRGREVATLRSQQARRWALFNYLQTCVLAPTWTEGTPSGRIRFAEGKCSCLVGAPLGSDDVVSSDTRVSLGRACKRRNALSTADGIVFSKEYGIYTRGSPVPRIETKHCATRFSFCSL